MPPACRASTVANDARASKSDHDAPMPAPWSRQKPSDAWDKDGGSGAWEIAARFSSIDLTDGMVSGGEQDNITLALNWYPNPATRWMLNFVRADVDNLGEVDFILTRWQVDF